MTDTTKPARGRKFARTPKTETSAAGAGEQQPPPSQVEDDDGIGMRLMREWNGTLHVVTIGEDGVIAWNGRNWASLSKVAREITGTRWSGPAFFGLKQKRAA